MMIPATLIVSQIAPGNPASAFAAWVPPTILVAVIGVLLGAIVMLGRSQLKTFVDRVGSFEGKLAVLLERANDTATREDFRALERELSEVKDRMPLFATNDAVARVEAKLSEALERLAALEATVDRRRKR